MITRYLVHLPLDIWGAPVLEIRIGVDGIYFEAMHITPGFLDIDIIPHGHTYRLSVEISGKLGPDGYILDLRELERIVRSVAEELDRALIVPRGYIVSSEIRSVFRKIVVCDKGNPTLENMALMIAERIYSMIRGEDVAVRVTLYEGAKYFSSVSYP